jgi:type VI protein secretion system component VasK
MPAWLAAGVLVASVGLTYLCCIRPMRRAHGDPTRAAVGPGADQALDADRQHELDRLRRDIASARQEVREGQPGTAEPRQRPGG